MPLEIVEKPKTEPEAITQHKSLVPLRVVACDRSRIYDAGEQTDMDLFGVEVGDVAFSIPGQWGTGTYVNATKSRTIHTKHLDKVTFVRAYSIARIVLTNDNEPAPV